MGFQQLPLGGQADPFEVETIHNLVDELLTSKLHQIRDQGIELDLDLESGDTRVPHGLFRKSLDVLITYAIRAMPTGGELAINSIDAGPQMELVVTDTGEKHNDLAEIEIRRLQDELISVGGNIETWSSVTGGSTRVLVFPVRRNTRIQDKR